MNTAVLKQSVLILMSSVLMVSGGPSIADIDPAYAVIQQAMRSYGGKVNWAGKGTLVVHESQTRYEEAGTVEVKIVHYMDINAKGYRVELDRGQGKQVYGWDGDQFWAMADGKPGDEALVSEARRVITDAFYRFSLPFILDEPGVEVEYQGKESVSGVETQVVRFTYEVAPASRNWTTSEDRHEQEAGHGGDGDEQAGHGAEEGDHHAGRQVYNYYFDTDYRIVKIYFSHHGDDTYETLLLGDYKNIDGIVKEHTRKLLRPDGNSHYDVVFTSIVFRLDIGADFYKRPGS